MPDVIKVGGLKELQANLKRLGTVSGTKTMRASLLTATKPILDKAKASAPVRSGALREAEGRTFRVEHEGPTATFSVFIGPKTRNRTAIALYNLVYRPKRQRRGIIHGHLLEFGTRTGTRATHWLLRSLQSMSSTAINLLAVTLKRRVQDALRK